MCFSRFPTRWKSDNIILRSKEPRKLSLAKTWRDERLLAKNTMTISLLLQKTAKTPNKFHICPVFVTQTDHYFAPFQILKFHNHKRHCFSYLGSLFSKDLIFSLGSLVLVVCANVSCLSIWLIVRRKELSVQIEVIENCRQQQFTRD